jgi:hypothetical protein
MIGLAALALAASLSLPSPPVLQNARVGLDVPVAGSYSDCSGGQAVPAGWAAWSWSCAGPNNLYLLGHSPGPFSSILALQPGDAISLDGRAYWVDWTATVAANDHAPAGALPYPALTLQTCDGAQMFVVRAHEGFRLLSSSP